MATRLGLVEEVWDVLERCWDENREARPDLQIIRACLHEVIPMWHVRKDLPLISTDDTTSLYTYSLYTPSPSPSPSPSPAPPSPTPPP